METPKKPKKMKIKVMEKKVMDEEKNEDYQIEDTFKIRNKRMEIKLSPEKLKKYKESEQTVVKMQTIEQSLEKINRTHSENKIKDFSIVHHNIESVKNVYTNPTINSYLPADYIDIKLS